MAPGVNGRHTGTVPKAKARNISARQPVPGTSRPDHSLNNIPNNLVTCDWQSMPDIAQNRTRKTSNSQASTMDYSDLASEGETTPDVGRPAQLQYQVLDSQQGSWSGVNRLPVDANSYEVPLVDTPRLRTPRNVLPDKENNITKMPDRNQVVTRLNQISDYIKQTSTLMDTLKNSGEPRHLAQHTKLSKMIAELQDSEAKLELMLPGLDGTSTAEETGSEGHRSSRSQSRPDSGQAMFQTTSSQSPSRGTADDSVKSTLSSRRNQLQIEVERSQRSLQVLEEQQRALVSLQQHAHQQLMEARAAQGAYMSQDGSDVVQGEGPGLQCTMQQLQERLMILQDLYENRNQLATMLGDNEEQLAPEHMVLQDKLQELQSKKQHMDHLVAQFNNTPGPVQAADSDSEDSEPETDHSLLQAKISELNAMKTQLAQLQVLMQAVHRADTPGSGEGEPIEQEDQAVNLRRQKRENNIAQASTPNSSDRIRQFEEKSLKLQEAKTHLQELQDLLATVTDLHSRGERVPEQFLQRLVDETAQAESPRHSAERGVPQPELTLEMVQAMTHDLKHQTTSLQEERHRLSSAQRQLGKMHRYLPLREKKTNTQIDSQTHQQLLLQTELRAKRRELEELMRKDQGQSSVNQDVCSETSVDKSDTPGYSLLTEGTTNATWGGSTQDTLGDMAGQDHNGRSAGYSSEDGGDDEEEATFVGRQLNNTTRDSLNQTVNTNRDVLNMSLESVRLAAGNPAPSSHTSVTGSIPAPPQAGDRPNTQGPHNVWRKPSSDSNTPLPRAVWTPQDRASNHEQVSSNVNAVPTPGWCQQQAFTLQQQLEVTSAMCQRMLATPGAVNPFQPMFPLDNYQPLLLANQLQQQQALLSTVNQCCQLLWLQQCELATLKLSVQGLQEKSRQQNATEPRGPHPNLKLSYSGGLLQPPGSCPPGGGVMGAQSLPNLSQGPPGDYPLSFPTTLNNAPLVSLMQPPPGTSWLQQGHVTPQALNNQVPPGNRANNYWDNFRSYSRQNLLSTSAKSNEGASNSPSLLVDRSHNSLRGCMPMHQEALQGTEGVTHSPLMDRSHNCLAPHAEVMQGSEGSLPTDRTYNPVQDCMVQHSEPSHLHLLDRSHNSFHGCVAPHSEVLNNEGVSHSPLMVRSQNSFHGCVAPHSEVLNNEGTSHSPLMVRSHNSFHGCVAPHSEVLNNEGASHSPLMDRSHNSFRGCVPHSEVLNNEGASHSPLMDRSHNSFLGCVPHSEVLNNEGTSHSPLMDRSHNSFRGCVMQHSSQSNENPVRSGLAPFLGPSPSTSGAAYHVIQDNPILSYNLCRKEKVNTDSGDDRYVVREEQAASNTVNGGQPDIASLVAAEINGTESCTSTSPHNKLCYSVYAEVAALIAANENRPHFLIQLFRDLQMVSSDPLRQRALQSIHDVVVQLPPANPTLVEEGSAVEITASEIAVSSDDDDITTTDLSFCQLGEPSFVAEMLQEEASQDGAVSPFQELPASSSSPKDLPRNAVWATDDLSLRLPERSNKMDWEVEGVLVDLLPFLRSHVEDTCTPVLLETVRRLTLQLIPAQNLPAPRPPIPARLGCIYQGQLDALLEDALLKFQGSRLQDVGEELLTVVSEVLLSELTFLRLVDTGAPQPVIEAVATCATLTTHQAGCLGEYNGDLAEADQSHLATSESGASNMLQGSSEETEGGAMEGETEPCRDEAGRGNLELGRELDRVPTRLSPIHSSSPPPPGSTDTTGP